RLCRSPKSTSFPYTTLFRSGGVQEGILGLPPEVHRAGTVLLPRQGVSTGWQGLRGAPPHAMRRNEGGDRRPRSVPPTRPGGRPRSEEHTSELQSRSELVCRL